MRYLSTAIVALVFTAAAGGAGVAFAQTTSSTQTTPPSPVEKAFQGVKDTLDNLVNAKDETNPDDLAFRITTFQKVIEFSITEANDLKVKLIGADTGKDVKPWEEKAVADIDAALAYYGKEKESLENQQNTINITDLKAAAQAFKEWRETHLLPSANAANDFLLITQEGSAIGTAEKRAQKIGEDVTKLKNARQKVAKDLAALLVKANDDIAQAKGLNQTAHDRFWADFITPLLATSTATSTTATSATSSTAAEEHASSSKTIAATGTPEATTITTISTSTEATSTAQAVPLPPSIRDLVKASLTKVREAYQVFIEMSTLVRKVPT